MVLSAIRTLDGETRPVAHSKATKTIAADWKERETKRRWSDRTKDKMYQTIEASKACFRRLNATHQIGCTSSRGGSTGVIHYCTDQKDLDYILRNGTAPPYVPIIPTSLFTSQNVNSLKMHKNKVSGLILYLEEEPEDRPEHFSHDYQCPNPTSSLVATCKGEKWNPYGTGLLYEDIPFPIFYVENAQTLSEARDCFKKHNNHSFDTQRDRALCSLQLNTFMYASTNTPTCIRRSNVVTNLNPVKFCDALGDQNVWASIEPLANTSFKHILVVARLDTTSLFEKTAGAVSPITGLVSLIATAKLLKEMLVENGGSGATAKKNVLFILFNGESYDYIGSQRFVYEMANGNFPVKKDQNSVLPTINLDDIEMVVELSQLSYFNKTVVAHYQNKPSGFLAKLSKNGGGALRLEEVPDSLPPASLHTFAKKRASMRGVVLAGHKETYTNRYYNSIFDNATYLKYEYGGSSTEGSIQKHTVQVSEMLAKSLYEEITGREYAGAGEGDFEFVDELYHCYLENANCRVHQAVQKNRLPVSGPLSLYVGVEILSNFLTTLAGLTLAWVTGDVVGAGNASCTNEPRNYAVKFYNMSKSLDELNVTNCVRVTMNLTEAVSPAFVIEDYDWSSGEYSSWAESTWGDIGLRMFLKPSAAHENMTIAIGSIVFVFSSLLVYFVKSKADVLFDGGRGTSPGAAGVVQPANC